MTDRDETDDPIASALLSDSPFERVRVERFSHFKQSIPRKLVVQSALLALLALTLPLYAVYPETAAAYLPAVDPAMASPKVLVLGVIGGLVELLTAVLLVAITLYRVRNAPVSEERAHTLLNLEDLASYLGLITGGIAILLTLAYFSLGLFGGPGIEGYVSAMEGRNPFATSGVGLTVTDVALAAFAGSVALVWASQYVEFRLSRLSIESDH